MSKLVTHVISLLVDARKKKEYSQAKLAEITGIKQPNIARMEKGESISLSTLETVANGLGLDVNITLKRRVNTTKTKKV